MSALETFLETYSPPSGDTFGPDRCLYVALDLSAKLNAHGIKSLAIIGGAAWAVGNGQRDVVEYGWPHYDPDSQKFHCWCVTDSMLVDPNTRYLSEVIRRDHEREPFSVHPSQLRGFPRTLVQPLDMPFLDPSNAANDFRVAHVYKPEAVMLDVDMEAGCDRGARL